MNMYDQTKPWRFMIDNEGNVLRGRAYRCGSEDDWTHYWDGGTQVAFYDEGFRGLRVVTGTSEDSTRAVEAVRHCRIEGTDETAALKRLAVRLTENPESDFIVVGLDRGIDLYALSWGEPNSEWADEIEAVWNHEVYRCEVEEYALFDVLNGEERWEWQPADDMCEEWYGEDKADEGMAAAFPLDAFPAEHFVNGTD